MKELVLVTRKCCFCQREAQVYMPRAAFERWQAGELIQFAWPGSTPAEREIAISGTHPSCFDKVSEGREKPITAREIRTLIRIQAIRNGESLRVLWPPISKEF